MDTQIQACYTLWCNHATEDPDLQAELTAIAGDEEQIRDRFYRSISFGTAGLRGVIGAGENRMNIYTVRKATQGLALYLKERFAESAVAIAYDSRIKSDVFAKEAARVLAGNGIKVYLFDELQPTPVLSFAVRELGCKAGIMVTASHNPSKYNGYKCYGADGCQMTDRDADAVTACIRPLDMFRDIQVADFDTALKDGAICMIGQPLVDDFLNRVQSQQVNAEICHHVPLNVIYTPLNGTGNKPVREMMRRMGVSSVTVVPEQELPDGNFPTAPYPNPEIRQAFACALTLAQTVKPDILLATDPDCDRVGVAVKDGEEYTLISGNEMGCLLLNYVLECRQKAGTLPSNPVVVKTIVSSNLVLRIAEKYACEVRNVLTGFKYIGEQIGQLEAKGEENRFVFGFEESYGYLAGTYVRDKDAVVASMLICEMTAYYKEQGKTLLDVLAALNKEHGAYRNVVVNAEFEGEQGMAIMQRIMDTLRATRPTDIAGLRVIGFADYQASVHIDAANGTKTPILLPKSNVLTFTLEQNAEMIVRPSGTEPKIKAYITATGADIANANAMADRLCAAAKEILQG